jgi:hypothetical protein
MTLKKLNLKDLIEEHCEPPEDRVPDGTIVSCEDCAWSGVIEDCLVEMESEGWEYPSYPTSVCPECGGGIDI